MAVNKVVMNTENGENTLIDLTSDTVTAETLAEGTTAHDASGNVITGVGKTTSVLYTAQTLTDEQKAQARANIGAEGEGTPKFFEVTITENEDGTYTTSHNYGEINAAYNNGLLPIAVRGAEKYSLVSVSTVLKQAIFGRLDGSVYTTINIMISRVNVTTTELATMDDIPEIPDTTAPFYLITSNMVNEDGSVNIMGWMSGQEFVEGADLTELNNAYLRGRACFLQFQGDAADSVGIEKIPCTYCDGSMAIFSISFGAMAVTATVAGGVALVKWSTPEFVITLTGNETDDFTSDKPYSDIVEAYESGQTLVCVWDDVRIPLVSFNDELFQFMIAIQGFVMMAVVGDGYAVAQSISSPITINGEVWDGDEPKDFTDTINAMIDAKAKKGESIYYIVGNGDTAGVWTGTCENITEYYDGLTILFKLNVAGVSGGSTLNINGLGACAVKRNATTAVTTTYPAGSIVMLTYSGGVWFTTDYDANTKTSAGTSNKVGTKMYLVGGTSQNSNGVTTYTNKDVYIGTDNCLYSNGKKVAEEEDIPTALKNPNALTINGKTYDGSEAVDITIAGGSASENVLLGQTPITLSEDANVKLVGSGAHTYSIKGKTIADLSTMEATGTAATLTEGENYIEMTAPQDGTWYNCYVTLSVKGLTVGASYTFAVKSLGTDDSSKAWGGYYQIRNSSGSELGKLTAEGEGIKSVTFTADTENITVRCYPANSYYWGLGFRTLRIGDIYINNASDGTTRTSIIDKSGTFTDSYALGSLSAGITITSDPSCEVYSVVSGSGGSGEAVMPLAGKTVVCFGDSLFGMYTGDTSAPAYVAKRTGATVHNVGFGGCRMSVHPSSGYAEFCMWALAKAIAENNWTSQDAAASKGSANFPDQLAVLKSIDFNDVDYIVIHYGTNDFNGAIIDNASNPKDYNTLCGALRYSIETLLTAYPKIEIFVSLPAFRFWTEDGTVTYSDTKTNTNGDKLTDFVKALADTAREYNLPVIDCYYGLGINKINAATFLGDGVHHNADGRKRFGEYIGAKLITSGDV